MASLLILGAGGHGKVVSDIASMTGKWDSIAFLDDREDIKAVLGFPVIGKCRDYGSYKETFKYAIVAIGKNEVRLEWLQKLSKVGFAIPNIIHPFSSISRQCRIGEGTVVMAGVVVNSCASIGKGCIINTSSSIDHDCVLDDGVHISPGVHVGGTVKIGKYSWLCIGSSIANNITIGRSAVVAAGSAVIHDVPDNVMVAGVPATVKKQLGVD